jgi:predicted RNA-binding protein YlxR (DUF448 family)
MKRGHVPIRTCKSCGKKAPKHALNRFVFEQGSLVGDDQGWGYGFYCCPDTICQAKMYKKLKKQKKSVPIRNEDGSN